MTVNKQNSILLEIETTARATNSKFTLEKKYFNLPIPSNLEEDPEKYIISLENFGRFTVNTLLADLKAQYGVGMENPQVRAEFIKRMRESLSSFFENYSDTERTFLILTVAGDEWVELAELLSITKKETLFQALKSYRDNCYLAWLNYQIYEPFLPNKDNISQLQWHWLENILFEL